MGDKINNNINENILKILRPLVRVCIRNGLSCGSFEELLRKAYVDEAFAMGKKSQLKTTISGVSAQTGLSRKEVKRLHETEASQNVDIEQKYNRAIRVISGWLNDRNFTDTQGNARVLPVDGENDSFASLVKHYSGDIPTKAMLTLLLAADCVKVEDNTVELIRHAYVPGKDSAEIIRILGTDTNELINTIDHNLTAEDADKRFQRKVSSAVLDKRSVKQFKELSRQQSQALLEELDAWISRHEAPPDDDNARYVSLGIYYYEQDRSGEK